MGPIGFAKQMHKDFREVRSRVAAGTNEKELRNTKLGSAAAAALLSGVTVGGAYYCTTLAEDFDHARETSTTPLGTGVSALGEITSGAAAVSSLGIGICAVEVASIAVAAMRRGQELNSK